MTGKNKVAIGINSITLDNKHILLMDFDIKNDKYEELKKSLHRIQTELKLSDIYILETENGYNAFCLDKFKFITAHYILSQLYLIDKLFLSISMDKKVFTLGMGEHKKYITSIRGYNETYEKSYAHYLYFSDIMNYPINKIGRFDNNMLLQMPLFLSSKYGIELECIK